jgi:hypothetical protein
MEGWCLTGPMNGALARAPQRGLIPPIWRARPMKAPSECNRPLRHGSELDAVSCAWARELALLRAILLFGLKKPRQRFEAMANWRR